MAIEIDKWAVETLKANCPNWNILKADITKVSTDDIISNIKNVEIDLISGGYPCQSFSYAGKKLGLNDTRGTLFFDFARFLEAIKPKMFLAENVRGLVSHDDGKTLKVMIDIFESVGYYVQYKVLNALDYGVAQKRQRVFIIGTRRDIRAEIGEDFEFPKPHGKKLTLREVLKYVKVGGRWRDFPDNIAREYMKSTYFMGSGRTGIARRLSWDEARLIVLYTPSQKQTKRCHPDEIHPFSVRENARIQSFPDSWVFKGSMAQQYKQVGNAVPVNLVKEVGLSIIRYLDKLEKVACLAS